MKTFCVLLAGALGCVSAQAGEARVCEVPSGFGSNGVYTVGCWIKVDDQPGYPDDYALLFRGDCTGFRRVQFDLHLYNGRPELFYSSPFGGYLGLRHAGEDWLANDGRRVPAKDLPKVPRGKWCHVAATSSADDMLALYLDGKPFFSGKRCGTRPPPSDRPVKVGISETWTGLPFHRFPGGIERVLLEPRVLTAGEIAARVERERPSLDPKASFGLGRRPMDFSEKLPLTAAYERNLPKPLPGRANRTFARRIVDGRPMVTVDGEPVPALAMMPSPYVKPEEAAKSIRDFAAAGVRFYSDIFWSYGALNDWWLGEGEYDFSKLDAKVSAALAAAPGGFFFPRIKLDPPDWWAKAHPGEMQPQHVRPDSAAWNALWPRMLTDVIDHFERSPFAGRIMGYQFGAFVGSEWIVRPGPAPEWKNVLRGDLAPDSKAFAPLTAWREARGAVVAKIVGKAARIVKERTHGNKLTGVFFGYGLPEHACFHDLLASPDVDYFCSPTTYHGRFAGEPGRFSNNMQASCRLHGKIYWDESDLRTHLYHKPSDWRHRDEFESVNAIRRAFGWSWAHGNEIWWFCLEGNGLFHSEAMMETVRRGAAFGAASGAAVVPDVAVFSDPVYNIPNESVQILTRERFERWSLPRSGVAWDLYHLADIAHPDLPAYRAYVFVNAYAATREQREAIKRVCRRKGATAIFFGAPGYYNGAREGVAEMSDLTGVTFGEHLFKVAQPAVTELEGGDRLPCLRLPRVFVNDDPAAKTFGRYRGWPVCVEKELPEGGRTVCVPAPPEAETLRGLFRRAGAHIWLESGDTLGAGRGTVMVHAASDGVKKVRLPRPMDAEDAFGDERLTGVTELSATLKAGETRVWRVR